MSKRHVDTAEAAKIIRKTLKRHFPGIKFGVGGFVLRRGVQL